jgi:hypothetical protein
MPDWMVPLDWADASALAQLSSAVSPGPGMTLPYHGLTGHATGNFPFFQSIKIREEKSKNKRRIREDKRRYIRYLKSKNRAKSLALDPRRLGAALGKEKHLKFQSL